MLGAGSQQTQKLDQPSLGTSSFLKLCKEDILVNIVKFTGGIFGTYCQSKDVAGFHNLQGKLEPVTLIKV